MFNDFTASATKTKDIVWNTLKKNYLSDTDDFLLNTYAINIIVVLIEERYIN